MTTVEVLKSAQDLVKNGWIQGEAEMDGCYCAMGAIWSAVQDSEDASADTLKATRAFRQAIFGDPECSGIATWNDTPGRTQQEVVEAFGRAIEIAQESEVSK